MSPISSERPSPLYSQIKDSLRAQIATGAYKPLDRIPSESELMQWFEVSRVTVRQALGDLEKEHLIFRVPGKGSFVARPRPFQELGRLQGFAEAMSTQGHHTWSRLLGIKSVGADAVVAERLQLAEGDAVTEVRRVRFLDNEPVSLDISYLLPALGQRLEREDLVHRDIFSILEHDYGLALAWADLDIDAAAATAPLAGPLLIDIGSPILRVERLTHTRDGQPVDFEYLYCRPDNFRFRLRVLREASTHARTPATVSGAV